MNCDKVSKKIAGWLTDKAKEASVNGFVVGISGGVDSALVSTLCALTPLPVFVVSMPIMQNKAELKRAKKHIAWLKANHSNVFDNPINLTNPFKNFKKALFTAVPSGDLAMANLRSRMRMSALYWVANTWNLLVVGTGNKVEDGGVGFFTKYGDGGVDISPIGDLMKSEVRELAAYLGVIPEIVAAAPTDGLWDDGRTDEDALGATYDELEWAMGYKDADYDQFLTDRQKEVLRIYNNWHSKTEHKMKMPPICRILQREK